MQPWNGCAAPSAVRQSACRSSSHNWLVACTGPGTTPIVQTNVVLKLGRSQF